MMTISIEIGTGYRYTIPRDILNKVVYYLKDKVIRSWKIHRIKVSFFDEMIKIIIITQNRSRILKSIVKKEESYWEQLSNQTQYYDCCLRE
jgi:hypothetical protein